MFFNQVLVASRRLVRRPTNLVVLAVLAGLVAVAMSPSGYLWHDPGPVYPANVVGAPFVGDASTGQFLIPTLGSVRANRFQRLVAPIMGRDLFREAVSASAAGELSAVGSTADVERAKDHAWSAVNRVVSNDDAGNSTLVVDVVYLDGAAARGGLRRDDRIVGLNGEVAPVITNSLYLEAELTGSVTTTVVRDDRLIEITLVPEVTISEGTGEIVADFGLKLSASIALTEERPDVPLPEGVTGPSGGLMDGLAYLDALTAGDLTGGMLIAGTGTLTPSGWVGGVGGVPFKVEAAIEAGATVFFVPEKNAEEIAHRGDDITIVAAESLSSAVRWLCSNGASGAACEITNPVNRATPPDSWGEFGEQLGLVSVP